MGNALAGVFGLLAKYVLPIAAFEVLDRMYPRDARDTRESMDTVDYRPLLDKFNAVLAQYEQNGLLVKQLIQPPTTIIQA